jgi:hypothetical protein
MMWRSIYQPEENSRKGEHIKRNVTEQQWPLIQFILSDSMTLVALIEKRRGVQCSQREENLRKGEKIKRDAKEK